MTDGGESFDVASINLYLQTVNSTSKRGYYISHGNKSFLGLIEDLFGKATLLKRQITG